MSFIKEYTPFYRRNLRVAGPIVLSQVGGSLVQLVDTFMVSRLGTVALAAVSFATAIFMLGFVFSNGLHMGATPIVGQIYTSSERAEDKKHKIAQILQNLFLVSVASSLILMLGLLLIEYIMPYMGQETEVLKLAIPYFGVLIISLFPNALFMSIKQFLEGLGNTSYAMIITLISNVINVVFNYFLIYGKCGFPEMGVLGAGIATLISRLAMPLIFIIVLYCKKEWWAYCKDFGWNKFSYKTIKEILGVGFPIGTHILMEMSAFAISGVMMGWLGAAALASHQIASNMSNLLFMVVLGISAATTIRVSHQYGAKDYQALRMAANASIHLCLFANIVMGTLLVIFRKDIVMLFSADPEVIKLGSQVLVMAALFQLPDGMQAVGAGILRGLKDVKITMYVAILAYLVINLPLGYLMAFVMGLGAPGIWMGFIGGLGAAAIMFRIRYVKDFKRIKRDMCK